MRLLEYEAKMLLEKHGILIPKSSLIHPPSQTVAAPIVLKSQVPVGGRGKLGGVVIVDTQDDTKDAITRLLSLKIKGYTPNVLLAEEKVSIVSEHYISLLVDRDTATTRLVAHKNGGIDVEANNSTGFINLEINDGLLPSCVNQLADYFTYPASLIELFLTRLYVAFIQNDALLVEINPLIYTTDGLLICGDCKMELDDTAMFRHPDWNFEEQPSNTNFVILNEKGTIATIANGAGLAMATVDAVAAKDMIPANFLDIGGGADTKSILAAFKRIMEFKNIDAIVINIFAGITRCDEVARAIIEARKHITDLPPLFIRLAGTNLEEAVGMLSAENILTLATLDECLEAAKKVVDE